MLLKAETSCLLIVDVQERLTPVIHERERVIDNCAWLMGVAQVMGVPVLVSEQNPRGLGHTVPALQGLVPDGALMEKIHFSCAASAECRERIEAIERAQIVVAGVEAHICVLQTCLDLVARGKAVYLVAEAVSSRRAADAELAIERMRAAGVVVACREMVLFEWAHRADTKQFNILRKQFL